MRIIGMSSAVKSVKKNQAARPNAEAEAAPVPAGGIVFDARGRPFIAGTTMKVIELVVEHLAYGWSPEELKYEHPYLRMEQIHAALAYYQAHRQEMDGEIEAQEHEYDRLRAASLDSPARKRLKAMGLV